MGEVISVDHYLRPHWPAEGVGERMSVHFSGPSAPAVCSAALQANVFTWFILLQFD